MGGAKNPFISSGECYWGEDEKAADEFIPCGNAELGAKSCCKKGDICLSSNACFNQQFGLTYLAGCSDPEYEDESCPDKGGLDDLPWTGLVYCNGTSNEWMACDQSAKASTLREPDDCYCPQTSRTVAFHDASVLTNIVSLPTKAGGSVVWSPGFVPTVDPDQTTITVQPSTKTAATATLSKTRGATSPAETGSPSSISTPSSTATPTRANSGSGNYEPAGLTTGAKIGIGVGAGAGGLVLLAALLFLFLARRRRLERQALGVYDYPTTGAGFGTGRFKSDADDNDNDGGRSKGCTPSPETPAVGQLDGRPARPWAVRSELPGTAGVGAGVGAMTGLNAAALGRPGYMPYRNGAASSAELPG